MKQAGAELIALQSFLQCREPLKRPATLIRIAKRFSESPE